MNQLSERQLAILKLYPRKTKSEIAARLRISIRTLGSELRAIRRILNASTNSEALLIYTIDMINRKVWGGE